jgi:16S rRNA (cytosine967-C5)-methyltransferase
MNSREIILDILLEISGQNEYSNILITAVLNKYDYLEPREKAFIKHVAEGTLERRIQIDYVLNRYSKVPVRKMKPLIRELLRMSVYQILFMENVPDAAVCNEAVKLAKKRKFQTLQGYVNGVSRTIVREKDKIPYPEREKDTVRYFSICYSMPEWLVRHFQKAYGDEKTEKILQGFLERQPVCVRIDENLEEETGKEILDAWRRDGVKVKSHPALSYAFLLEGTEGISRLYGYQEGYFTVQDVSSMMVVEEAGIQTGDVVLDVCAAPGGKTMHAACKLHGTGQVIACDVTEYKTQKIEENCERLGYENVTVRVQDARVFDETLEGKADVVIADVPCSGLGVIGKKQDIKYRVTEESLQQITELQREIIRNVVRYVKPGGTLMYSTCTINAGENEKMVEWICEQFAFEKNRMVQLLPGIDETDGFFYARLRRNSE